MCLIFFLQKQPRMMVNDDEGKHTNVAKLPMVPLESFSGTPIKYDEEEEEEENENQSNKKNKSLLGNWIKTEEEEEKKNINNNNMENKKKLKKMDVDSFLGMLK